MAAIAIVLVAGLPVRSWALLGFEGVSYDGSLELSAVRAANEDDRKDGFGDGVTGDNDRHSDVDSRVRLGLNLQVTEGVDGRIEFVRTGERYGTGANSLNDEQNVILIQNAFVNLMLWDWRWRVGRQYVGDEGDLVWNIGPRSDDILRVDAIDGLDISRSWESFFVDAFFGKASDSNPQGGTNDANETSLKNLTLGYSGIPNNKIWLGAIWGSDSNTGATSDSTKLAIYRAGIRGGINENFFTYRGEALMNGGSDKSAVPLGGQEVDFKGTAFDLGAGVNLPESGLGQLGFGANYTWTSGDDDSADTDDDSFRDLLAVGVVSTDRYFGEIFGRSNGLSFIPLGMGLDTGSQGTGITILHLNALYKPAFAPKSWARLDWYDFDASEDQNIGDFGSEIDLTLGYRHSDTVGFEAGYAMLSPDELLETSLPDGTIGDDDITKAFARMKIAFGGGMQQIDAKR